MAKTATDLFVDELRDTYDAEQRLLKELPELIDFASADDLKQELRKQMAATREHIERLASIIEGHNANPEGRTSHAMAGLIRDCREMLHDSEDSHVADAGLIGYAQRMQHFEIAAFGTLQALAEVLGLDSATQTMKDCLEDVKNEDRQFTMIAISHVNEAAAGHAA